MPMTFTRRRPTSCARMWSMFRPATRRDSAIGPTVLPTIPPSSDSSGRIRPSVTAATSRAMRSIGSRSDTLRL